MKKKALVFAIYLACATPTLGAAKALSSKISGLNLGEVKSYSNIGEKFKGIIPILHTSRKQAKKLKVRLAPKAVFAQLGTERIPELKFLNFKVSTYKNKPVIIVSSNHALRLPILNFIIEIENHKGVIYQDYTVMMDFPSTSSSSDTTTANVKNKSKEKKAVKAKTYKPKKTSKKITSKYRVKSGDTLSTIAKRYKRKGISLKKMMKGIYRANPKAFVRNNINKIKKGALLHIPSAKKIKKLKQAAIKAKIKNKTTQKAKHKAQTKKQASQSPDTVNTYKVKRGDTLARVTKKFVYEGVSFTKMMKEIHTKNPEAFLKNRTILKEGARLQIPTFTEVAKKQKKTNKQPTIQKNKQAELAENTTIENSSTLENKTLEAQTESQLISNATMTENKEIIDSLKMSNKTIDNLQKRIRELRGDLTSTNDNNQTLTEMLFVNRNEEPNKANIQSLIKQYNKTGKIESETHIPVKEIQALTETQTVEKEAVDTLITKKLSNSFDSLSAKDLTYAVLALLLGFTLIRYRERIYAYSRISYDHPKFYPSAQDKASNKKVSKARISKAEKELLSFITTLKMPKNKVSNQQEINIPEASTILENIIIEKSAVEEVAIEEFIAEELTEEVITEENDQQNLIEIDHLTNQSLATNIESDNKPTQESSIDISEESFQECNLLIDELINDLSIKPHSNHQEIDKILEADNTPNDIPSVTTEAIDPISININSNENIEQRIEQKIEQQTGSERTIVDILNDLNKTPSLSEPVEKS